MTPNNIPQGYKATALGIIPQEWEVRQFKDIGTFLRNNTLSRDKMSECDGFVHNIHYGDVLIKYKEIIKVSQNSIPWISERSKDLQLGDLLQDGDIVISDTAEDYTVGKATELSDINGISVVAGLHTIPFRPLPNLFATCFLGYYINSMAYRFQLYALVQGTKVCAISKKALGSTFIILPPLAEQRKIAEVLGVWDEAIEKQARLIEKLALRKRALMQRLLSAKLRLPGFSEPWKEQKINKITTIKKGEQVNKDVLFSNAKYPVINGGITPSGYLDTYNTKANTITISEGGNSCGYVNFMTTPFWSGGHCYTIDAKDGINNLFIYQLLKNNEKYIMSLRVGSGLPNIQIKDLGNIKFMIPTYQEQTAIAEVLIAADREIELAKEKLERLRRQKRGLMQQLLTGKKRVNY